MSEETKIYEVTSPVRHDGESYAIGAAIGLTDAEARPLLAVGAVSPLAEDQAPDMVAVTAPTDPAERHMQLKALMAEMEVPDDPRGSEVWTNGGKPDASAVADALGWDSVSAKERDAAWAEVAAEREAATGSES